MLVLSKAELALLRDIRLVGCLTMDELFNGSTALRARPPIHAHAHCPGHDTVQWPGMKPIALVLPEPPLPDPRERAFTQLAAKMIGGHNLLNAGLCPTCGDEIGKFRNDISRKEFGISGMCQKCQDSVFGVD